MGIIVTHHQGDFSGGQVDALFEGQIEHPQYKKSLRKCLNFVPSLQGGAIKRPGTYVVDDLTLEDDERVIGHVPYKISEDESFYVVVYNTKLEVRDVFGNKQEWAFSSRGYNPILGPEVTSRHISYAVVGRNLYLCVKGYGVTVIENRRPVPFYLFGELEQSRLSFNFGDALNSVYPWSKKKRSPKLRVGDLDGGPYSGSFPSNPNYYDVGPYSSPTAGTRARQQSYVTGTIGDVPDSVMNERANNGLVFNKLAYTRNDIRSEQLIEATAGSWSGINLNVPGGTIMSIEIDTGLITLFTNRRTFSGSAGTIRDGVSINSNGFLVLSGTPTEPADFDSLSTLGKSKLRVLRAVINESVANLRDTQVSNGVGYYLLRSTSNLPELIEGDVNRLNFSISDFDESSPGGLYLRPTIFNDNYIPNGVRLDAEEVGGFVECSLNLFSGSRYDKLHNPSIWPVTVQSESYESDPTSGNRPVPFVAWENWQSVFGNPLVGRGSGSWPNAVSFFQNRLILLGGRGDAAPFVFGSKVDEYDNFVNLPTVTSDDEAVPLTPSSATAHEPANTEGNELVWGTPTSRGLMLGYEGEEVLFSYDLSSAPAGGSFATFGHNGSNGTHPVLAGQAVIFPDRSKVSLREILYYEERGGLESIDLNLVAKNGITDSGFFQLAYMQGPQSIVWAVMENGDLLGMTYDRGIKKVSIGWHIHQHGSGGKFRSVAVVNWPGTEFGVKDSEALVLLVEYPDGGFKLEVLPGLFQDRAQVDYNFLDGAIIATGEGLRVPNGLSLVGDGYYLGEPGTTKFFSVGDPYSKLIYGHSYNSELQMLRPSVPTRNGVSMGKKMRIHQMPILLKDTNYLKYGTDFDNLRNMLFRESIDKMDTPTKLYTGMKVETMPSSFDFDNFISLRSDRPFPCTILAVSPQLSIEERM